MERVPAVSHGTHWQAHCKARKITKEDTAPIFHAFGINAAVAEPVAGVVGDLFLHTFPRIAPATPCAQTFLLLERDTSRRTSTCF
ncbi:MAG TPA: hypothetical protein ACQGQF_04985 [Xylella fastidiosa subsp. pauca]